MVHLIREVLQGRCEVTLHGPSERLHEFSPSISCHTYIEHVEFFLLCSVDVTLTLFGLYYKIDQTKED